MAQRQIYPWFLPDGRHFLYTLGSSGGTMASGTARSPAAFAVLFLLCAATAVAIDVSTLQPEMERFLETMGNTYITLQ